MQSYDDALIKSFLSGKHIAIVGLSDNPDKVSYQVGKYLKNNGYKLYPIYPKGDEILGFKVYRNIAELPYKVDVLNIFRKSEAILDIVKEAIDSQKTSRIWVQLGLHNQEAKKLCAEHNIPYIEDICIKIEHQRLGV
ncbi:hypothetical protein CCZ01_08165 [Helicobacter monodelphidis]|uniref:CoA-binding protein n=1 Tax=Helicobacter sp. 15-1451 TaxID=2004995 RepID=UPI000DCEB264|nr:CoA-binding protein [Helicobacter sp. 15-1451]RAX56824.1 hypothetical protein CCZ01_08165 [Helicobacter sp. 15-1451]